MAVRPTHLEHAKAGNKHGWISELGVHSADFAPSRAQLTNRITVSAGATFAGEQADGKMTGSWFLIREESLTAARKRLEGDIYVTGGAWDMSKVRCYFRARRNLRPNFWCGRSCPSKLGAASPSLAGREDFCRAGATEGHSLTSSPTGHHHCCRHRQALSVVVSRRSPLKCHRRGFRRLLHVIKETSNRPHIII